MVEYLLDLMIQVVFFWLILFAEKIQIYFTFK